MEIKKIWFTDTHLFIETTIGHIVGNPLSWFPRLNKATPHDRNAFVISPTGTSIHWEKLDEDLGLEGFFKFKTPYEITPAREEMMLPHYGKAE